MTLVVFICTKMHFIFIFIYFTFYLFYICGFIIFFCSEILHFVQHGNMCVLHIEHTYGSYHAYTTPLKLRSIKIRQHN